MFVGSSFENVLDDSILSKDEEIRKNAGIIDARRFIHIFYDPKSPLQCKVIQINISTTKGTNVLFDPFFMNRHNGTLSFVSVYVYDCELNTVEKDLRNQFGYGKLTLLTARRCDRETDYDRGETRGEAAQLFSRTFQNYSLSDYVDSRVLVHPKYYTQEHEYYMTGDFSPNGMLDDIYIPNLIGNDIVDSVTKIYQQNPNMYKTIKDTIMISENNTLFDIDPQKPYTEEASASISDVNFVLGCDNLVNGGVFVYDSQLGIGFKNAHIMCKNYITKETSASELESFLTTLESTGKRIENKYGNLRLMYSPSLIGSKCRIIYKDMMNKSTDNLSEASKDNSHEVTEVIGEMIESDSGVLRHNLIYEEMPYGFFEEERLKSYF